MGNKSTLLLPETANYQLVAQGEAKKQWLFTLTTQPYQPLDKDAGIAPTSPVYKHSQNSLINKIFRRFGNKYVRKALL